MKKLVSTILTMYSMAALADLPVYYWDNQEKLVEADSRCKIQTLATQDFRFSTYYGKEKNQSFENMRTFKGVRQSYLVNGSIVKIVTGEAKAKHEHVEVVGVNKNARVNRWYSDRGDKGYLFFRSLLPMEDRLMKIPTSSLPGIEKTHLKDTQDTYWSIASAKSFYELKCPGMDKNRDYVLFRVYMDQSQGPELLVAVSKEETSLFEKQESISKYKIGDILPNFLTAAQDDIDYVNLRFQKAKIKDNDADLMSAKREYVDEPPKTDVPSGTLEDVVCIAGNTINVRSESLDKVLYSAERGEKVKRFQGWGENLKTKVIEGEEYTFVKVQFSGREESDQNIGWVANRFIKAKSQCPYVNNNRIVVDQTVKISGLDDPNCCDFPTVKKPTHPFNSGMRSFGSGRSDGKRLHAACDLYRYEDEDILSVAPGTVIQDIYYFYLGTYALEVKHSGGFVVRYGEIKGSAAKGVKKDAPVQMGQKLGKIGQVNLNVRPMLHFELYDGSKTGSLSNTKNGTKYQRREDLMDPTNYLIKWENKSF